jgi:hypothetical protein
LISEIFSRYSRGKLILRKKEFLSLEAKKRQENTQFQTGDQGLQKSLTVDQNSGQVDEGPMATRTDRNYPRSQVLVTTHSLV